MILGMKNILYTIILSFLFSNVNAAGFLAVISCEMQGRHIGQLFICFDNTDLKLTNNGTTNIYKSYQVPEIGEMREDGFYINLSNSFSIRAQNSDEDMVLKVRIFDANGNKVYEDAAGQYGVVSVSN